jgi:uncharacterized membrane protein
MAHHPIWVLRWLSEDDLAAVSAAIAGAERRTSAEIRVHLDRRCAEDPMVRAAGVFERLQMHDTRERSGVLVYVALDDHRLAVIGDRGIHERVGHVYWERLVTALGSHFAEGRPGQGLIAVVDDLGRELERHFPRRPDDVDELTDALSVEPS